MTYLYHAVPSEMRGSTLYPLNQLRYRYPDLYEHEMAKYHDHPVRQTLPETTISPLDCLWNDVIHTAPIDPHLLYREWARLRNRSPRDSFFYRIPLELVRNLQAAVMTNNGHEKTFKHMDWDTYSPLVDVPKETSEWYSRLVSEGKFGAHFVGIPHILVRGTIDISHCDIVSWQDAETA